MRFYTALILVGFFAVNAESNSGSPWTEGQPVSGFTFMDQHDKEISYTTGLQWIAFSKDKAGSTIASKAFEGKSEADFSRLGLVYVADISGMPGLISRMVALPKMRKYAYRVALDRDGKATAQWPHQSDSLTLIKLQSGTIGTVKFLKTAEELSKALGN